MPEAGGGGDPRRLRRRRGGPGRCLRHPMLRLGRLLRGQGGGPCPGRRPGVATAPARDRGVRQRRRHGADGAEGGGRGGEGHGARLSSSSASPTSRN